MSIATGVAKQVKYKVESAWGTIPSASTAQLLRRVTSNLSLTKDTYESAEIRPDYQVQDFRHGVRKVEGSVVGELSPGTYKDFFAAALRRDFAAVSAITGASITIAGSGPTYTVTRGAGSFLTDGVKAGDVVRLSAGSFNAANLAKNLIVISLTATVLTVSPLNGVALVAEGPIASSTVTVTGKKTYTPTTGHTDKSYSFEHWFSDIAQSEVFSGMKVSKIDVDLPSTGIAKVTLTFMGKDVTTSTSEYFTSPTAATTAGVLAAVNGLIYVDGTAIALITSMKFTIDGNMSSESVVGSNTVPDIFEGTVKVNGEVTAFFEDGTLRDYFLNETEVSMFAAFTTGSTAAADFVTFSFPRVKAGGSSKDDGQKGIVQTIPFTALYNSAGGAGTSTDQTTLVIQDSLA